MYLLSAYSTNTHFILAYESRIIESSSPINPHVSQRYVLYENLCNVKQKLCVKRSESQTAVREPKLSVLTPPATVPLHILRLQVRLSSFHHSVPRQQGPRNMTMKRDKYLYIRKQFLVLHLFEVCYVWRLVYKASMSLQEMLLPHDIWTLIALVYTLWG